MDQVSEIAVALNKLPGIAGSDFTRLEGWLRDTRHQEKEKSSLLGNLAEISLTLIGKSDPEEKERILSKTRCEFSKKVLEELLEMRSENAAPSLIIERFQEAMLGYAMIVEFPYQLKNLHNNDLERKFFRYFLELNFPPHKTVNVHKEEKERFVEFNNAVRSKTEAIRQGILGELLIFALLDKLGFAPEVSRVPDDQRGIDLFVYFQKEREQKVVEVQVKTDSFSPDCLITVERQNQRLQIAINTTKALQDPRLLKELLSRSSPSQKSEEWREIITKSIKEVIECRQK